MYADVSPLTFYAITRVIEHALVVVLQDIGKKCTSENIAEVCDIVCME